MHENIHTFVLHHLCVCVYTYVPNMLPGAYHASCEHLPTYTCCTVLSHRPTWYHRGPFASSHPLLNAGRRLEALELGERRPVAEEMYAGNALVVKGRDLDRAKMGGEMGVPPTCHLRRRDWSRCGCPSGSSLQRDRRPRRRTEGFSSSKSLQPPMRQNLDHVSRTVHPGPS